MGKQKKSGMQADICYNRKYMESVRNIREKPKEKPRSKPKGTP